MAAENEFDAKRVLVVDDDGPMLRTHGRVLESHGFRPVLMADPAEALEEAIRRLPSVIVLDLVMPGMSGLEFMDRLRHALGRSAPPTVLISAHLAILSPTEQLTFDALFPKPYAIDTVIRWVRRLAIRHYEQRRAASEVQLRPGAKPSLEEEREG